MDRLIYVPPPDLEARREIFKIHTQGKPLSEEVDLDELSKETENFTGADIEALCNEASMLAIRSYIQAGGTLEDEAVQSLRIGRDHFDRAMEKVAPKRREELERYVGISKGFERGMEVA